MSDFGGYNDSASHNMWTDYTYSVNTRKGNSSDSGSYYGGYRPLRRGRLPEKKYVPPTFDSVTKEIAEMEASLELDRAKLAELQELLKGRQEGSKKYRSCHNKIMRLTESIPKQEAEIETRRSWLPELERQRKVERQKDLEDKIASAIMLLVILGVIFYAIFV